MTAIIFDAFTIDTSDKLGFMFIFQGPVLNKIVQFLFTPIQVWRYMLTQVLCSNDCAYFISK
jgi:hypothetical protein